MKLSKYESYFMSIIDRLENVSNLLSMIHSGKIKGFRSVLLFYYDDYTTQKLGESIQSV
jgi:hypothetical protein